MGHPSPAAAMQLARRAMTEVLEEREREPETCTTLPRRRPAAYGNGIISYASTLPQLPAPVINRKRARRSI